MNHLAELRELAELPELEDDEELAAIRWAVRVIEAARKLEIMSTNPSPQCLHERCEFKRLIAEGGE